MGTKVVYVLESCWTFDNENPEYATITVEEPDMKFEVLMDPKHSLRLKTMALSQLKKIADAQSGNPMGETSLAALYRISGPGKCQWVRKEKNDDNGVVRLDIEMEPICGFDKDGNPVPIEQSFCKVRHAGFVTKGSKT